MITAATSGGLGDIVFSIPAMKKIGVTHVYIKEAYYYPPYGNLYLAIKDLLAQQGFIVLPTSGNYPPHKYEPGLQVDYDMDKARLQPNRGRNHIIISYLNTFNLAHDNWSQPWLNIQGDNDIEQPYTLIHLTPRWRDNSKVNWRKILHEIKGKVHFIGFQHEWIDFCTKYGNVSYLATGNILELAILIRDCEVLYCNQSVALSLAQGMGKKYFLERKPGKTNCLIYTENENLL
jgi:hypothetical protein